MAKATVAYDFLMVDGQETTSSKKSYLISSSPDSCIWCMEQLQHEMQRKMFFRLSERDLIDCPAGSINLVRSREYKQRCMGPTEIEYEFHLWNGNERAKEFSRMRTRLPVTSILLFCLQTLCLIAAYRVRVRLEAGGKKLHLTTRVLTEAVAFERVAHSEDVLLFEVSGQGPGTLWLDTLSRVCHGVADVEIVILLVLLGKGWTIVRHKFWVASRMKLAAFAATYAMASFACLACVEIKFGATPPS